MCRLIVFHVTVNVYDAAAVDDDDSKMNIFLYFYCIEHMQVSVAVKGQ